MMLKTFKFRLLPNKAQQELLSKHFGCARFVYNWGREQKIQKYQQEKISLSCNSLVKGIVELKKEYKWLAEVNSQSLQMALRNLDNAYTRFFREKKGFPKFKNKRGKQSFQCPQRVKSLKKLKALHQKYSHRAREGKKNGFKWSKRREKARQRKMCSKCGWIKKDLELKHRRWHCEKCGFKHDRDVNAAKNIKSFVLHRQNLSYNRHIGLPRINAQGDCCVSGVCELRSGFAASHNSTVRISCEIPNYWV